jgi:hypothetical protein
VTLPERIADWRQKHDACAEWIGGVAAYNELLRDSLELVPDIAAAYAAALTALESSDRDRRKLREELKCSHDTLCKIGGAVRFFFPDIPIAGDTVANIEAEAVKVKARLAKLEAVRPHLATVLEHAERCRLGPQEIAAFKAASAD